MDELIVELTEAAVRCEGKGQLNVAKTLRAGATALTRRLTAARGLPDDPAELASDLKGLAGARWAASNVMRHLRDAESLLNQRIELILEQDDPPLVYRAAFDQPPDSDREGPRALEYLAAYESSRRDSVARLREIGPEAWGRTGRHQELGRVTLAEQASYFAAHELTHLRQLEMLRRAMAPGGGRGVGREGGP